MKSRFLARGWRSSAWLFLKNDEAQTVTAKSIYTPASVFFMNIGWSVGDDGWIGDGGRAKGLKDSCGRLKFPRQLK